MPTGIGAKGLTEKLAEVLQSWPLYRELKYDGKEGHHTHEGEYGNKSKFGILPDEIVLYCPGPKCRKEQHWQPTSGVSYSRQVFFSETRFHERAYMCRNCDAECITYFLRWKETAAGGAFVKVGQFPPLSHHPPKELASRLDEADRDFYRKALDSRNFSYGLGAVAYLRRVIENRVDDLLDLLVEAVKEDEGEIRPEILEDVKRVKEDRRIENKLDVARKLLPPRLKRGHDPLGDLYDLVSDAIHRRSEEECIDVFDAAKNAFEYLFTELERERITREQYHESLKTLKEKSEKLRTSRARSAEAKETPPGSK